MTLELDLDTRVASEGGQPSARDLETLAERYDRGQFLDAWSTVRHLAPLREWRGPDAMIWAGRLGSHLGAGRVADALLLAAARWYPDEPRARYYGIRALLSRRGPLEAWRALRRMGEPIGEPKDVAESLGLRAHVLALMQDFREADRAWQMAWEMAPGHEWLLMERASILEEQDRFDESTAVVESVLERRPWYHPAVLALAHGRISAGRTEEAIELLTEAVVRLQSPYVASMLAGALAEKGDAMGALAAWERYGALAPLMDKGWRTSMLAGLAHAYYLAGDLRMARRFAEESDEPFLVRVAARMAVATPEMKRVVLDVPVVRQHKVTCVPATLEMLGSYWQRRVDQRVIADEITYSGTPTHLERGWAEANGWIVREFSLDWDAAVALLDRGIPFTLTTRLPLSAHEQAVAGYDAARKTLLIRDPGSPFLVEWDLEGLLEIQRAYGPRAMAMVPRERGDLLDGLTLKDADIRDALYALFQCLERHDRAAAHECLTRILEADALGTIALEARRVLAAYDGNVIELLAVTDAQIAKFPDDSTLVLQKLDCLEELDRRREYNELLSRQVEEESHPVFLRLWARECSTDGERFGEARRALRRYLTMNPVDPEALELQGNLFWGDREFEEAHAYYHLAACLGDTNERLYAVAFRAAAVIETEDRTLEILRDRFERNGARSSAPARTLFWALLQRADTEGAFDVLERALEVRPHDGDLKLFAADAHARAGRYDRAAELVAAAEGTTRATDQLVTRARIAGYRGNLAEAAKLWRAVLVRNPLDLAALDAMRSTLAALEGRTRATALLRAAVQRFPFHLGLRRMLIEELRDGDPAVHEEAIREAIDVEARDAWSRRELALLLGSSGRLDEARAQLAVAERIEPGDALHRTIRGRFLAMEGKHEDARRDYLEAVALDPDDGSAIVGAADTCQTAAERREVVHRVHAELMRQAVGGEGLAAFVQIAEAALEPEELVECFSALVRRHDHRWQAWCGLMRAEVRAQRMDEARATAGEAARRFPATVDVLVEAALVHRQASGRDDAPCEDELALLRAAVEVDPTSGRAASALASALRRGGEPESAVSLLEEATLRAPLDGGLFWMLAEELMRSKRLDEALVTYERAARLEPDNDHVWRQFDSAAKEAAQNEVPLRVARDLARERPHDLHVWMAVATLAEDADVRLEAIDKVLTIAPRHEPAHDLRAVALVEAGRFEDARSALESAPGLDESVTLRGRRAWVDAMTGDLPRAIRAMKLVVRDEPRYSWGWALLAAWGADTGRAALQRLAARELIRIDEEDGNGWSHRGDASRALGDLDDAIAAYQRALEIDEEDAWATLGLCGAFLDAGRFGEAESLIPRIKDETDALARRFEIALAKEDSRGLISAYRESVTTEAIDPGLADFMARRLTELEMGEAMLVALDPLASKTVLTVRGAWHWAHFSTKAGRREKVFDAIPAFASRSAAHGAVVLRAWGDEIIDGGRFSDFDKMVKKHADLAKTDLESWGCVGYGFARFARWRDCIEWMTDVPAGFEPKPWMLYNLALSYRSLAMRADAAGVSRRALALDEDHTTSLHRVWAAYDAAVEGDIDSAFELSLVEGDDDELPTLERIARIATDAVLAAETEPEQWLAAAKGELKRLKELLGTLDKARQTQTLGVAMGRAVVDALIERHGEGRDHRFWRLGWSSFLWDVLPT